MQKIKVKKIKVKKWIFWYFNTHDSEHAWPCSPKIWKLNCNSHGTLLASKKSNQKLNSLLRDIQKLIYIHLCNLYTRVCVPHPHQNMIINLQLTWNFTYLQKKQNNIWSNYGDIKNLLFWHTLGMPGHAWPHLPKIWQLTCSSHRTLLTRKKSKQ